MPNKKQVSVSIPEEDWELAERAAKLESKKPTRWIREQIHDAAEELGLVVPEV